jgi:hypothetical protein
VNVAVAGEADEGIDAPDGHNHTFDDWTGRSLETVVGDEAKASDHHHPSDRDVVVDGGH